MKHDDDDKTDPGRIDPAELQDIIGSSPMFRACSVCGGMTSGGGTPLMCWDCAERKDRGARARQLLEGVVPPEFAWASFASPHLPLRCSGGSRVIGRALEAVGSRRVVLVGGSGVGKTSLAVAMMRLWVEKRAQAAHFTLSTELASARTRAPFGRESSEVTDANAAPLLVLDDLGADADVPRSAVAEVIFKRHAEQRPLWITTWLTPEKMSVRYGDGITRRIFEGARVIECGEVA